MSYLNKVGNSYRLSTVEDTSTSIYVGSVHKVGKFFWVGDEDYIGCDSDWKHGHNYNGPFSVSEDCWVTVRGIKAEYAIVRLDRPQVPYGAQAAIGIVFQIPIFEIESWPALIAQRDDFEKQRRALAKEYCR